MWKKSIALGNIRHFTISFSLEKIFSVIVDLNYKRIETRID